ncbi:RNA-directed DNA polymerase, eukaryota, reverse transcriptase zinc-binding domain protein [Tanacetum coccineum]
MNGACHWELDWGRSIRGRACKELDYLVSVLQNVVVSTNCRDKLRWTTFEDGEFKVKDLLRLIEDKVLQVESGAQETIWNKLVPKRVNIFVWRALKGRLLVRDELDKRGIDLDLVLCPSCTNAVESCAHSLVTCDLAMNVWDKVFSWQMLADSLSTPLCTSLHRDPSNSPHPNEANKLASTDGFLENKLESFLKLHGEFSIGVD